MALGMKTLGVMMALPLLGAALDAVGGAVLAVEAAAARVKAALLRAMRCGSGLAVMAPAGLVTVVGFVLVRLRGLGERRHACGRGA